ncbi:serine/threonine-protein phosphatase 2A 55 kDa regulatory subunit B delta isoform isoform X6 [Pan troglodytes]|uniref:serine/threonine-protein phosphatase 2A 55 kDa regulatory subunit B delta isoform isoform X6 n=1 Tax=Pan troglodytes TaxID=9598 RepID=UPI0023F4A263|nr:serine/threonine-protein phosphatase 2A 55 kDa regulatory subunit B delta isoform isoform X4 [Pan troglodytes]XP_054515992.1 serine/threonine-protein phosphatase 2A 55 kDa regulatory subunit B delta isoform isoform X4 [Pan troglodytes]
MAGAGGGGCPAGGNDFQWCFSQVKGAIDEDVAEADIISTVEFNYSGDLLATGDKGGRVVIFQREQESGRRGSKENSFNICPMQHTRGSQRRGAQLLPVEASVEGMQECPARQTQCGGQGQARHSAPARGGFGGRNALHVRLSAAMRGRRGAQLLPVEASVEGMPCTSDSAAVRNKSRPHSRGEYNVYSTFQSHEPEFDYLKSLEIEEKINKIRWLPQQNAAHFLLSTNDKTIKLWKISERDKRAEGYNLKDEDGRLRDPFRITALRQKSLWTYQPPFSQKVQSSTWEVEVQMKFRTLHR